jgi:uncharacterized membrane protein
MPRLAKVFGIVGGLLVAFMAVGFLLPGTWSAEVSIEVQASPETVYPLLADLGRWDEWTQWADVKSTLSDPSSGSGAVRSWDDDQYGSGSVTITESRPSELIRYRVRVGEGAEVTGTLELEESPDGSVVTWREEGDFGRNPLMGYIARTMSNSQEQQLSESLDRLKGVVGTASGGP